MKYFTEAQLKELLKTVWKDGHKIGCMGDPQMDCSEDAEPLEEYLDEKVDNC